MLLLSLALLMSACAGASTPVHTPGPGDRGLDECTLPDDAPAELTARQVSPRSGVRMAQVSVVSGPIAPALGSEGGWFITTGEQLRMSANHVALVESIERADEQLEPRWSWHAPDRVTVSSLAASPGGGVVAVVLIHGPTTFGQRPFDARGGALLALDRRGRLRWVVPLFEGEQRLPHYLAVEGQTGRIALGYRQYFPDSASRQGHGAAVLRLFSANGEAATPMVRPYEYVSGLVWLNEERLLMMGDHRRPEPSEVGLLPGPAPSMRSMEGDGAIAVIEVLDPRSGQAWWRRDYARATANWSTRPALAGDGSLAFVDLFFQDRPEGAAARRRWPQRMVVLDTADGSVRWTRLLDSPRRCGGVHLVGVDPRDGSWLLASPRDCNGYGRWPTSALVERFRGDGERISTTLFGRPMPEHMGPRLRRPEAARLHLEAMAVDRAGRPLLTGLISHANLANRPFDAGDLEHFLLTLDAE